MSLMPFSSRSSSRSSGGGDAGGEKKLSNRKYTISLSFSGLITSGIITIIAIGWIFAFGVIVGRGYNPEKKMPELARLLPPPEGQDAPKEAKGILKPEELTFMTDLKQTQPAANAAPNKPEAKAAHPTAQPVAAATPKPEAASADKAKYDFVFQAVAYKSKDSADKLRERMEGEGLRTRMTIEKDNKGRPKWFRVQVLVRGTDADASAAKQVLVKMGLKDATQVSKSLFGGGERMDILSRFFAVPGALFLRWIDALGDTFLFLLEGLRQIFIAPKLFIKVLQQLYVIGTKSLFVICLIALFTGMVLGLQGYYVLVKFGSVGFLGAAVSLTLIRELGPVLTAIMVTGRAGSSMAAEIGVMRITDQIDALEVMDIPGMGYLVAPRFVASLIAFPLLTAIFDVVGIIGGYLTGVLLLGVNEGAYFHGIESSVLMPDVTEGFIKSFVFALLIALICCYQGYNAHRRRDGMGPEAVANATTSAVVISCVFVLVADYVVTSAMLR